MEVYKLAQSIGNECIAAQVRKLNRAISNIYDNELRADGLKISQFNILVAIAQLGEVTPQKIGSVLKLEKSTLSRGLERAIKKGWLKASYSNAGRIQTVTLTNYGEQKLQQASHSWSRAQKRVKELIDSNNLSSLFEIVESLNSP